MQRKTPRGNRFEQSEGQEWPSQVHSTCILTPRQGAMVFLCAFHIASKGLILSFYFTLLHPIVPDMDPAAGGFPRPVRPWTRRHHTWMRTWTVSRFFFFVLVVFLSSTEGKTEDKGDSMQLNKTRLAYSDV